MRTLRHRLPILLLCAAVLAWSGCSSDRGTHPLTPDSNEFSADGGENTFQAIPAGYYDTVDMTSPATFRSSLHGAIDDHLRYPYTSTATDTWDILELADEDPGNSSNILDVYKNASYAKQGGGNTLYNREHVWAKSYGFPNDGSSNYPYTDCHHLFLSDDSYNSSRSNKPFRDCDSGCLEKPTDANNGAGGGTGVYPGNSNWTSGSFTAGTWEVWHDRRGDIARAMFYMDVRYEGGTHGGSGVAEPDLILTDNEALIAASNTGSNESVGYMGMLTVLLQWHLDDPVDDKERARNESVYAYQGNRNPFIDHPEWVDCMFNGTCGGDTTPPAAPTGLLATGGDGVVDLDWANNAEGDLDGYHVYRATASGGPFVRLDPTTVGASQFSDGSVSNGTAYWYRVTAVDVSGNESANSATVNATPQGGGGNPGAIAWINEFHYDNSGTDTGEFFEIAGTAGTSLSGWTLLGYNGNGGTVYATINLSGTLPDQLSGYGTLSFSFASMQNGSPDGLALVDDAGVVVEFLSYEGTMVASGGAANGMTSTNVGVSETTSTPVGWSLQLTGSGAVAADFAWQAPMSATSGQPNTGQSFGGGAPDTTPPAVPVALVATAGDGSVDVDWADNSESDLAGYTLLRGTSSGGPYSALNGTLLTSSAYVDNGVTNGTTYYYVVQAEDLVGNVSANSSQASATPQDMTPPSAPTALVATAGDGSVDLDWANNGESDLAGYDVLRSTSSGGPYSVVNGALLTASAFTDMGVSNGTTYYYVVRAEDLVGNVSGNSGQASATPQAPPAGGIVWINEFHYDNSGKDRGEFVEVAGSASTNLSGWTLVAYNGNNGSSYKTVSLSGTISNMQSGFGVRSFSFSKLQNGSPDGIALVDDTGAVVEFLSYEGSFTASNGPAAGLTSTDIGVSEPSSTSRGHSLQRTGSGNQGSDFTWQGPSNDTPGSINSGQSFTAGAMKAVAQRAPRGLQVSSR